MDIDELNAQVVEALEEPDLARAARLLDSASGDEIGESDQPLVVGLWEDLADAYAERGRFDESVATIRRLLELDYAADHDVRGSLAVQLLRADREDEADELWEVVATEQPEEVTLRFLAGVAYQELGRDDDALGWFDEALELVLEHGDREGWLVDLLQARDEALAAAGEQPDDLQKRGEALLVSQTRHLATIDPVAQRRLRQAPPAVAWFPQPEWERAAQLWPQAISDSGAVEYQAYARDVQRGLLEASRDDGRAVLAPIYVDAYLEWCEANDADAADPGSPIAYALQVSRLGNELPWPPRRGEPCWCGSGAKYKKCCATVTPAG